jgi:hypothetical protein
VSLWINRVKDSDASLFRLVTIRSVERMSCSERFKLAAKAVLDRETEATEKVVKMSRSAVWEGKLAAWHD